MAFLSLILFIQEIYKFMATPYGNAYVPKVTTKSVSSSVSVAISSVNQLVTSFIIMNPSSSTGVLYVGGSNVVASISIALGAGDSYEAPSLREGIALAQYDLAGWYLKSSTGTISARIFRTVKQLQA